MSNEEKANTLTHLVALIATVVVSVPLTRLALAAYETHEDVLYLLGVGLFLAGMLFMYACSTVYHAVSHPVHKWRLRVLDHISIYVMIAGSYSVVCLTVLRGWIGWSLFVFLWACVVAGMVGKMVALGRYPKLSLALYLLMGWVALLVLVPMWRNMPHEAFWWIVAEGVFYTIGAYFFRLDEQHAYYHAIWHVFIMFGSLAHTMATFLILTY